MKTGFLTNYSNTTFLEEIKKDLRECKSFCFSVSFIKKAGLVLLNKEIIYNRKYNERKQGE